MCPKLTRDLDDGLYPCAVHFDLVQALPGGVHNVEEVLGVEVVQDLAQRVADIFELLVPGQAARNPSRRALQDFVTLPVLQKITELIHDFFDCLAGCTRSNLVRTDLVNHVVDHIAQVQRIELPHAEISGELQAGVARCRLDAMVLLEKQDPEAPEARILQRHAVLGLVHAEAARSARPRGEKNVVVDDFLARETASFQRPQEFDEVADRKVSRITLPVVAIFLTRLERGHVGVRQHLEAIAAAAKNGLDEALVFPGKASEKNGDPVAFFCGEEPLHGAVKVLDGLLGEPRIAYQSQPFGGHAPSDLFFH